MALPLFLSGLAGAWPSTRTHPAPEGQGPASQPDGLRQPLGGDQRPVEHLLNHGVGSPCHLARVGTRKEIGVRTVRAVGWGLGGGAFSHCLPRCVVFMAARQGWVVQ